MSDLPPGLAGFVAAQQDNERRQLSQIQQATARQGLLAQAQELQSKNQLRQLLAETGGDVEKAMQAAIQTGNLAGAHQLAPLVKMEKERKLNEAFAATQGGNADAASPDRLDAMAARLAAAGHPGAASVAAQAERRRKAIADAETLKTMQSRPEVAGGVAYGGAGDIAEQTAQPGQAGLFASLTQSPHGDIAQQAKNLQAQMDSSSARSIPPQMWQTKQEALQRQHEALANRPARNVQTIKDSRGRVLERNENGAWDFARGPDGKPLTSESDAAPTITNDTLQMDAWRYLTDGTLPPNMGRGQQGAQQATAIRNQSAALAKEMGMTPDEIRMAQLTNKGQVAAIAQLGKARAQILQFEKTASMNADLALDASEKVDRTGVPVLNRWLQAGRTAIAGDVEAQKFHAATETFVSEYAKVMSGGYGAAATTEGAQSRAHQLLSTANTKEQFRGVVAQLKKEMDNRVKALNGQMDEERGRLRSGIRPNAPTSAPAATPVPAGGEGWSIKPVTQ